MAWLSLHRITRDHPSPRFRGKKCFTNSFIPTMIAVRPDPDRLCNFYAAQSGGPPHQPFDEACERAEREYAIATTGQKITVSRASAKPSQHEHAFKIFADRAVAKLRHN